MYKRLNLTDAYIARQLGIMLNGKGIFGDNALYASNFITANIVLRKENPDLRHDSLLDKLYSMYGGIEDVSSSQ